MMTETAKKQLVSAPKLTEAQRAQLSAIDANPMHAWGSYDWIDDLALAGLVSLTGDACRRRAHLTDAGRAALRGNNRG